ncbi:MAG: glycine cleavage system protein GcvH [Pseudomonadota bacterium]
MGFPDDLKYLKSHEWIRVEGDSGSVGISGWAAEQIGEVVSVELPELGREYDRGEAIGAVESSKASSEIYSPVTGKVIEVNEILDEAPEKINESPYGEGWIFKIKFKDKGELGSLLDSAAYQQVVDEAEEDQ